MPEIQMLDIVRDYILNKLIKPIDKNVSDDDSLFQSQLLGLDEFVELTIFLEETFGSQVPGEVFGLSEFDTIHNITKYVEKMTLA